MANDDVFANSMRAVAAELDLQAAIKNFEAARTRGDVEEAEVIRHRARDLLDNLLDLKAEAIEAIRVLGRTR